jgi:hypothetical protein
MELRTALQIAGSIETASWLLKPYIERRSLILMVGAEGTFKSFLALHWALQIAAAREPVLFLSAEGRGLSRRIRAWCKAQRAGAPNGWADTLHNMPFLAIERPLNLSDLETLAFLNQELAAKQFKPAFVVVDTLTRNSNGLVERSNEDFMQYLNAVDQALRVSHGASVLFVHHIGHAANERARGPASMSQATDANFLLTRPDPLRPCVTVKSGRMKDCEPPAPFEIQAEVIELDEAGEDGRPETSLALHITDNMPTLRRPTGKQQIALLAELEERARLPGAVGVWTIEEVRRIGREIGMSKSVARAAVIGLQTLRYLNPSVGGLKLVTAESGQKGTNGVKSPDLPPAERGQKDDTPLGVSL